MNTKRTRDNWTKHVPVRMCVICRERAAKTELSRYVRTEKGHPPLPDPDQKEPGRGVYVCGRDECRKRFERVSLRK